MLAIGWKPYFHLPSVLSPDSGALPKKPEHLTLYASVAAKTRCYGVTRMTATCYTQLTNVLLFSVHQFNVLYRDVAYPGASVNRLNLRRKQTAGLSL